MKYLSHVSQILLMIILFSAFAFLFYVLEKIFVQQVMQNMSDSAILQWINDPVIQ